MGPYTCLGEELLLEERGLSIGCNRIFDGREKSLAVEKNRHKGCSPVEKNPKGNP